MKDYIIRGTAGAGSVRVFATNTKNLVSHAQKIHNTTPVATAALGRTLTAAAIMGAALKNDTDILTIDIRGNGPLGGIVAVADNKSRVKGYVFNPVIDLLKKPNGKLDVGGGIGIGVLSITRDMGLKEPVTGQVELISGEIAEDIAYYYTISEQTPSSVILGTLVDRDLTVKQSGGIIIQSLPFADEEVLTKIEQKLAKLAPLTVLLDNGKSIEDIIEMIFEGLDFELSEKTYPEFYCSCSREKTEKALLSVGKVELEKILAEDGEANLHCHFCNTSYRFGAEDIRGLITF